MPGTHPVARMVHVAGGNVTMGSTAFYPEEQPRRVAHVEDLWVSATPVTNDEFAAFVADTAHVTTAESPLDPADFPGADPALLVPGGVVFVQPDGRVPLGDWSRWWAYVPGANWRAPTGPGSDLTGLGDHPVVQVSHADAEAYADWCGARLPSEAEWEHAARGGLADAEFCWGDEPYPDGVQMANTWQGEFPWQNLELDGFARTSPVGSFPPNGHGLYDMAGNVWEWTTDWWTEHHVEPSPCCGGGAGRSAATSSSAERDSVAPGEVHGRRVIKGGSHLCAPNYCLRFRPAARQPESVDTSTSHVGFRIVRDRPAR